MRNLFIFLALFSMFASCKNDLKFIPEEELGDIIVQSVVTESFLRNTGQLNGYSDTLNFYLPVLDKYGYTVPDVEYTIERMIQRKSNVFGQLMDKISEDVGVIKSRYEYLSNMARNWRGLVKREIVDTLFFSPDSMHITNFDDLKMLDYKVPIAEDGELIVKYNYKILQADSNYSRYFVYRLYDSLSSKKAISNNYWLNKSDNIRVFEREIPVRNSLRANMFDMRVMSYTSREEMPLKKDIRGVDFYIDSVMILFRPPYEIAEKRMLQRLNVPILTNINYVVEDSVRYKVPFDTSFVIQNNVRHENVRYSRVLPKATKK